MDAKILDKIKERIATNPYVNFLGIHFTKIEDGLVEAHMPLRDEQRQYSGVTHGGVLTAELKISFLRAAWGYELIARGFVIKPGRRLHFCECEIYCDDKLVGKASGTFCVVESQVD